MNKSETIFQKLGFKFAFLVEVLKPPLWSIKRVEPLCQKWLVHNPKAFSPRKALALTYLMNEKNEEARREFKYLQEQGLLTDRNKIDFAEALYKLNKYQEVVELLASFNEKDSMVSRANEYLGKSYMRMGMYEKGLVFLERLKENPKLKYEDYWNLGYCYSELHRYEEALEAYMTALRLQPNTPKLQENVAYVHCQRGLKLLEINLMQAEEEFTKALQYWPDSQRALDGLAQVHALRQVPS